MDFKTMTTTAVRPEDVLNDKDNFTQLNGVTVRKGSIAAFLKNIDILEDAHASEQDKEAAREMIKQLTPAIVASGLYKHAAFKNKTVQDILDQNKIINA